MDRKQVEEAARLLKLLTEAEADLERAKGAAVFRLEMRANSIGPAKFDFVGHCDGVADNASGSYGVLAVALRAAAIQYFEFHRDLIAGQLRGLGVGI